MSACVRACACECVSARLHVYVRVCMCACVRAQVKYEVTDIIHYIRFDWLVIRVFLPEHADNNWLLKS